jgi:predicted DNA-binding ribbon-helix-helix protein
MSVDALDGPVPEGGQTGLAHWVAPQFRVITTGDRRRGVRLERVFWRLLDGIAERRGLKRAGLIREILDGQDGGTESVASTLRCYAAEYVDRERSGFVARLNPTQTITLMQQSPMPAFAINRQKKLQQVNDEFMQLLRPVNAAEGGARTTAEFVHLGLDTPIDELFRAVATAPSTQCNYTLQVDDRRRRGRAKIVVVPSEKPDILVGYVLP